MSIYESSHILHGIKQGGVSSKLINKMPFFHPIISEETPSATFVLFAHYPCEDSTVVRTVVDIEGDYHASLDAESTAAISETGYVNDCLHLENGNHINVSDPFDTENATQLGLEGYFKISAWGTSGGMGAYVTLFDSSTGNPNVNNGFYVIVDNRDTRNNHIAFAVKTTNGLHYIHTDGDILSLNTWFKVKCTYSDGSAKIFIDDTDVSVTTTSSDDGDFVPSGDTLTIGALNSGSSYEAMTGWVDEIKFYK